MTPTLTYKTFATGAAKTIDPRRGIIDAVVSITGMRDQQKDNILPGAYQKVIASGKMPRIVWSHANGMGGSQLVVVGKTLALTELMPGDPRLPNDLKTAGYGALVARGQFNMDTQRGREAFSDIAGGYITEYSVGFLPGKQGWDAKAGWNAIEEVDILLEWSPVLMGAATSEDGEIATSTLAVKATPIQVPALAKTSEERMEMAEKIAADLKAESVKVKDLNGNGPEVPTLEGDEAAHNAPLNAALGSIDDLINQELVEMRSGENESGCVRRLLDIRDALIAWAVGEAQEYSNAPSDYDTAAYVSDPMSMMSAQAIVRAAAAASALSLTNRTK